MAALSFEHQVTSGAVFCCLFLIFPFAFFYYRYYQESEKRSPKWRPFYHGAVYSFGFALFSTCRIIATTIVENDTSDKDEQDRLARIDAAEKTLAAFASLGWILIDCGYLMMIGLLLSTFVKGVNQRVWNQDPAGKDANIVRFFENNFKWCMLPVPVLVFTSYYVEVSADSVVKQLGDIYFFIWIVIFFGLTLSTWSQFKSVGSVSMFGLMAVLVSLVLQIVTYAVDFAWPSITPDPNSWTTQNIDLYDIVSALGLVSILILCVDLQKYFFGLVDKAPQQKGLGKV